MAGMFDFFGGGTTAAPTTTATDSNGGGMWDWMQDPKNKTSLVAMLGGAAKAVDPQGQTAGGQLGSAISGMATSKIMADKAAQDAAERKLLLSKLGLTPPGQAGPTSVAMGRDGQITTVETPTSMAAKPQHKFNIPSAFGEGGASNFP